MRQTEANTKQRRIGRGWVLVLAFLALGLLAASLLLILDGRTVRFYRYGDAEMTLEFGTPYEEPGVYAVTNGALFGEGDRRLPITVQGAVDPQKLGSYVLRYSTRWLFSEYSSERRVSVVDTTPPSITLKHVEGYVPTWMTGYAEEGYTALDACDGDLTGKVHREDLGDRIVYTVHDSSGNEARAERELPLMSYEPPTLTLLGEPELYLQADLSYSDPGCLAADNLGNDLSAYLAYESDLVPYLPGSYTVRYSLVGADGTEVSAERHVTVYAAELPESVRPAEKTIYLTFDDGPGPYTAHLLDVLQAYGVKATFFVTAADTRYADMIGRASREGHSIGVHSATHDYNKIYASEEAFFADFFAMEEIIYQQTGSYTRLFRFPGGSSNTVSRFNPGVMSRLTKAMNALGYQYYDWNVSSGDAGETNKTEKIIQNIKDGCKQFNASVVLQHDIKDYSVAAVEAVIQWGLENGYTFRALQLDSPSAHHGVNN